MSFFNSGRAAPLAAVIFWAVGSFVAKQSARSHTFHRGDGRFYLPLVAAALAALFFGVRRHRAGWRLERGLTALVGFLLAIGLIAAVIVFVAPTATRASVALPLVAGSTAASLAAAAVLVVSRWRG